MEKQKRSRGVKSRILGISSAAEVDKRRLIYEYARR